MVDEITDGDNNILVSEVVKMKKIKMALYSVHTLASLRIRKLIEET